jgi:ribosomal protein S18 acetylase RimI-like enzyme
MTFENVAANLRESFRTVAASRAAGENRELRGVSIASAGVTFQMFNAAFLSGPVASDAELAQRILLANTHFEARGLEWAYWVCEDWLSGRTRKHSRRAFESLGLRHSVDLPGMVAERLAPPVRRLPELDVRRVTPGPVRDAFCAIGALCFHVPPAWFNQVFDSDAVWDRFAGYVAYADEEPVATTAIILGGGAMGVYNVATVPTHQRRGFGEAVMRHALEDARRRSGVERVVLQSTPAGLKLYQRMGFRTVTRVSVYAS